MKLRIHSFETLGAHDGPGLRTVVFFQGCPIKCFYCHNPDMIATKGGIDYSVQEIVAFCKKYKLYHGEKGGVTLSGGEPLMQAEGALDLIRGLKKEGFNVCLDTSGAVLLTDAVKRVLNEIDIVLFDIKHTDADKYFEITGQPIENMLKMLDYIKTISKTFYVRQVIVPNLTDDEKQIKKLKKLAEGAKKVELLPYHTLGAEKWKKLGMEYKLKGISPPSEDVMKRLNSI
ncbi:MAG: pyruvate formate-lyase-activating protein [Firmicutes bacterium]|nr:pyruvate formate-lyase-activating protein [Bacillota bacterium]